MPEKKCTFFQTVIESSPTELKTHLVGDIDPDLEQYARVLLAYRFGNTLELKKLIPTIKTLQIKALAELRLQVRERNILSLSTVENMTSVVSPLWLGEFYYVLAMAFEVKQDHNQTKNYFLKSYLEFTKIGFTKKAVKALLNSTAAESRLYPDGKYIPDYQFILENAMSVKEHSVASIALTNISREYQKFGALNVALEYCDRALDLVRAEEGTQQYDLIVAHRAHLLTQLDRHHEVEICIEHLKTSEFLEVKAALEVIQKLTPSKNLLPTWAERVNETEALEFGELEETLMQFLANGPKTRSEIIQKLYGDKADPSALENRFFNLLNRIKKKCPGLIYSSRNTYGLSDRSYLVSLSLAN